MIRANSYLFGTMLALVSIRVAAASPAGGSLNAPTVGDGIRMTGLGSPSIAAGESPCKAQLGGEATVANFAPNGKEFVVVLRTGNVADNLIDYSMLLWKVQHGQPAAPHVILKLSSSSVRAAIDPDTILWSADSRSVLFLGERPGGSHELFRLDIATGRLRVMASYPGGSIINYASDASGATLAYEAALPREQSIWNADTARHGLVVTWQSLENVETGTASQHTWPKAKLFVKEGKTTREIVPPLGSFFPYSTDEGTSDRGTSMSPDGRYLVATATVPVGEIPENWRKYRDPAVQWTFRYLQELRRSGQYNWRKQSFNQGDLERYILVDLRTGRTRVLLSSPVTWMWTDPAVWAPDDSSIVLSDVLMPIGQGGGTGSTDALSRRGVVEINLTTGVATPVDRRCEVALQWRGNTLTCSAEPSAIKGDIVLLSSKKLLTNGGETALCAPRQLIRFQRIQGKWRAPDTQRANGISVFVRDGLNFPPKLYYRTGNHSPRLLLDLNPQLDRLRLAKEKVITWEWAKGESITGGLYVPTNYRAGKRYPLVIQTHVFSRDKFNYFGGYATADAAQPLAARGIFVLQINDTNLGFFSPGSPGNWQFREVQRAIRIYKSAISHLSNMGLIDPKKIGIIGFSHTCFFVDWAITHDPDLFAAASVSEGADGSYLEYMVNAGGSVQAPSLYSGPPFGQYLNSWVKLAPIFNIDHVRAPLWIGIDHHSIAYTEWEWFGGLNHLSKPVYMVVLDGRSDDDHVLVKPWDRQISSGGNADWFDFWLNGHESNSPSKAEQYAEWRRLRVLYQRQLRPRAISWNSVE